MHAGMVGLNGQKMSKSLGNLIFVREALKEHSAEALRWYLLSFPYRAEFSYEPEGVVQTEARVARLREALTPQAHRPGPGSGAADSSDTALDMTRGRDQFIAALNDDLNTPLALEMLHEMTGEVLSAAVEKRDISTAQTILKQMAEVMGFRVDAS
jgi:L-cysteine:1D-myo-inositol 2-amino-2-deoxy-alpha-D-glucopyranoside ligase